MKDEKNILEMVLSLLLPLVFAGVFVLILVLWFQVDNSDSVETLQQPQAAVQETGESEDTVHKEKQGQEDETDLAGTAQARQLLADMSLEDKVAQLFVITPEALTGIEDVTAAGESTSQAYDACPVGGLVYFQNNLESEDQLRTMLTNMRQISTSRAGVPAFLSIDEEGGEVARIANHENFSVENTGPMREIGRSGDKAEAHAAGAAIGGYLKDFGFNLDYAPVADVAASEENSVIGNRSFGTDPQTVGEMTAEAVKGFKSQGMLTVLKHFPGHGSTTEDSHQEFAYNNKTKEELKSQDFVPFQSGIEAGADMVMVGHICVPNVTGDDMPSSLSAKVVTDILRGELGFKGLVITDALNMGAISGSYESAEAAVRALEAGCDLLLMPEDFQTAFQGVLDGVNSGRITEERIDESVKRILEVKTRI
ncbi:MAG: glycoside hydrolase family 3 protein [Lachnospiraceae bacterium]|nr:glycoside hydrolase family 3 protein [Lachnospiraceae bacterium]